MSEIITKLQPNRTMQLRGFDAFGAAAAMHSATANAFTVSGVFRDSADFAVLVAYDADNFYEHASLKYLPDFDFSGLSLNFDVKYTGLRPLDSPRYATIDWPYLDVIREDNTTARIRLSDHATLASGNYSQAAAAFTIVDNELKQYDRVTLWYLNFAFDYLVPQVECAYAFVGGGAGTAHRITVGGVDYTHTETATDTNTSIAEALRDLLNASPLVEASTWPANQVNIRVKTDTGAAIIVTSSASAVEHTLYAIGKQTVAAKLADQINSVDWNALAITLPLTATALNGVITVKSMKPGVDGNAITMYAVAKNDRLRAESVLAAFEPNCWHAPFTGGSSDVTWSVSLHFGSLGVPSIRQMWFTFAPPLPDGAAFDVTEWKAEFSNWVVTGPAAQRELKVAGPDSVRVEENSTWCKYTGAWSQFVGFYSGGFCRRSATAGDHVEVFYSSNSVHDLYIGTTLYADRGRIGVRLDGDARTLHNFAVSAEAPIYARRKLRSNVPAGRHSVEIDLDSAGVFDFDFLEAAVPGNVPAALPARAHASPALDYSTDHTYKLPPSRIHWIFDQLGFAAPMNEYLGVFWWNERKRVGGMIPSATITLGGTFVAGDQIIVDIGGSPAGKTVFPHENLHVIAKHLASFINENLVGVWASHTATTVTITARSPQAAYAFPISVDVQSAAGTAALSGGLSGGQMGTWTIDEAAANPLNRAARDWHTDFFAGAAARSRELVIACSMELVNPPAGFSAMYPDGQGVVTDVGFANLKSTHCAFNTAMREFQKKVYLALANLQAAAGLTPTLQFGEFLWWFFTNQTLANPNGGMGFYDAETTAEASSALGRALHVFRKPTDSPLVNAGADAIFLRNRLRDHIAALRAHVLSSHPTARFELLYPYDVNHPVPAGVHSLGGALNRFVNFPIEYEAKGTSGLDTIKMEALDFGAWSRSLDLSRTAIEFPLLLGWPKDSVRYLVPVFRGGSAWEKEYLEAKGQGIPVINFWAHDHVNLYSLNCREPQGHVTLLAA
jgi:phage tail sheath gpL-like